jgi:hypothetical protein
MTDYIRDNLNRVWIAVAALIVLVAVIAALSTRVALVLVA